MGQNALRIVRNSDHHARRGFTIAELMIVLIILGVVLAIILPSLASVNASAKKAASASIMSGVSAAVGQFAIDREGNNPGYFSAQQMGDDANVGAGFTGLQNIMLDLMAGVTTRNTTPNGTVITVGPGNMNEVNVDLSQIGASEVPNASGNTKSYYRPDAKYFYTAKLFNGTTSTQNAENAKLPMLHDAFGSPIAGWQADTRNTPDFARVSSTGGSAKFYWNSNAALLSATVFGSKLVNQSAESMFGPTNTLGTRAANRFLTLQSIVSNPAAGLASTVARGPIVLHSAGANALFVGNDERGGKLAIVGANPSPLFTFPGVDPFKNGDFDDLVVSAGN